MLDRKKWYQNRRQRLQRADPNNELDSQHTLLLQVELGLYLLPILDMQDEPVEILWVLLTNHPFIELEDLEPSQHQALARARHLLHFGRYAWLSALEWYSQLPPYWRMFNLKSPDEPAHRIKRMTKVIDREKYYQQALSEPLPFKEYDYNKPQSGEAFHFKGSHGRDISISFEKDLLKAAKNGDNDLSRLPEVSTDERRPIKLTFGELGEFAGWVEKREEVIGDNARKWSTVIGNLIRYRPVQVQGLTHSLGTPNEKPLEIEGLMHIAGMVGSGKTTLANLLAMYGVKRGQWRTTLVVGDTHSAIERADYFNRIFGSDASHPAAVVLMGRTTRESHLRRLVETHPPEDHWGLRWLDTVCPLQGLVSPEQLIELLSPGEEPCNRLFKADDNSPKKQVQCPLFSVCPSREIYRHIPKAQIWITTPGAMAFSRLPVQLDTRRLTYAEMIYHYANLVIFDEIDADQEYFDKVYAPEQWLIDSNNKGSLQSLAQSSAGWFSLARSENKGRQRWHHAFENSIITANHVCGMIETHSSLQKWCDGFSFFSSLILFRDLTKEFLKLQPMAEITETPWGAEEQSSYWKYFWAFQNADKFKPETVSESVRDLFQILREIQNGGSLNGDFTSELCRRWIREVLDEANNGTSVHIPENVLIDLAQKLELAVSASALDFFVYVVSEEYPDDWDESRQRLQRVPNEFLGILPSSPSLSQGFRYTQDNTHAADSPVRKAEPRSLVMFQYKAIGRSLLMNFDNLRTNVGYPGPHVIAMSGTSWMPASATNHFAITPIAVLEPNQRAQTAIQKSEFTVKWVLDEKGNPFQVSGSGDVDTQLRRLAIRLAPHLKATQKELACRVNESDEKENLWKDRQRILLFVNSYAQSRDVAERIASAIPEWSDEVYYLGQGARENDTEEWRPIRAKNIPRSKLETFGLSTEKRVLVAPLAAVGRRHNILNIEGKAAFGAVYFLTRPMSGPGDLSRWTRWLNRLTLQMCHDPDDRRWRLKSGQLPNDLLGKEKRLRSRMSWEWSRIGHYKGYRMLPDNPNNLNDSILNDLAATMAARIIQAAGRLLRDGVPFLAYFVDKAWAPNSFAGNEDTPKTSILVNMIRLLELYNSNPIGKALYGPLYQALSQTHNLIYDSSNWDI